ncbi:MAG: PSD1 and planctomycete cytochrome C domain-containing protein [Pirellula sp.]
MKTTFVMLLFAIASIASAQESAPQETAPQESAPQKSTVDFTRDIRPILRERCTSCHGAVKQESQLRLDTARFAIQGGENGVAVVAGDPTASLLLKRIQSTDENFRMPPEGKALSSDQIDSITKWIASGAIAPADEVADKDPKSHWAFRKPVRPSLPTVNSPDYAGGNPIDALIQAKRSEKGLVPSPVSDRATLLRRIYLDLVGLPPSAYELSTFLNGDSPDVIEQLVDRLLASPQYGERWGRHWMDVWRYSDWYGRRSVPDVMNSYPMIWRWRDWIVRSINQDKPYDQMVVEMLAADETKPEDDENIVATGFLVRSWFKWNYETWKKDLVEHTGKAFLGLTLNCCQCHDHKYDPLSQEDYFRFRAFFEPLELRHDRVPGEPDPGPFEKYVYTKAYGPIQSGMIRVFDEYLSAETFMFSKGDARLRIEGKPPVTAAPPTVLSGKFTSVQAIELPISAAYPGTKAFIQSEEVDKRKREVAVAEAELAQRTSQSATEASVEPNDVEKAQCNAMELRYVAAKAELSSLELRMAADAVRYATGRLSDDKKAETDVQAMIRKSAQAERDAALATARYKDALANADILRSEARVTDAKSGDKKVADEANKALQAAKKKKDAAKKSLDDATAKLGTELGEYTPLSPKYLQTSSGRRTALAQWIVDKDNPLAARVAVNHIWLRHFGQALVDTTHDFGLNGTPPNHPELLDWLACELLESGWSMKHMHRLIVTSKTYQLASMLPSSRQHEFDSMDIAMRVDPENRFYWKFPNARMQAEVVRDSLLHVANELDMTMGGHEIDHKKGLASHRRSIYFSHHGEEKMEFLELFDAANACDCYKRSTSVQPQQALALTNSELTLKLSRALARQLAHVSDSQSDHTRAFIHAAFRQVLGREPRELEVAESMRFLEHQARQLESSMANSPASWKPDERARENLIHVLMNHNDFITVR